MPQPPAAPAPAPVMGGTPGSAPSAPPSAAPAGEAGTANGRRWRGQPPEQRRAQRRQRLLTAGLELFAAQGYTATSLVGICARAGVSPRHFYEWFPDREALLRALYDDLVVDSNLVVRAALARTGLDPAARVQAGLAAAVGYYAEDPRRAKVMLLEVVGVSPALDQRRREVIHSFAGLVAEQYGLLAAAGRVPARDFALISVGLLGALNELLIEWLLTRPQLPPESVLPAVDVIFTATFAASSS